MPLFAVDLDDTLLDRQAAFAAWCEMFARAQTLPSSAAAWLLEKDFGRGLWSAETYFANVVERYGLVVTPDELLTRFRDEIASHFRPPAPATIRALAELRAEGWKVAVVTNGSTELQLRKMQGTDVLPHIDAWCVSEEAGAGKPNPGIFELAAQRCATTLAGAWMVGDSENTDIAGGRAAGTVTAWIARGRRWSDSDIRPDLQVESVAEAGTLALTGQFAST
jgi:HAD superfamily hydrolase (TIGR01662 family)